MGRAIRLRVALLGALVIASTLTPVPAVAATPTTVAITMTASSYTRAEGSRVDIQVTPASPVGDCGQVYVFEDVDSIAQPRGHANVCYGNSDSAVIYHPDDWPVGTHTLYATFAGYGADYDSSESNEATFTIEKAPSNTSIFGATSGEANVSFQISASPFSYKSQSGGSMSFFRTGVATPICTLPTTTNTSEQYCTVPGLPMGTYSFRAEFSGTADIAGSTSSNLSVSIGADTVHAQGVGLEHTTFYPVKDAYKDTVAIRGTRDEPISVTAKIYSPGGTLLKSSTVAQSSGAYSIPWDGRKSDGTIRPEGKYKVVQTLKDANGITKSYTNYVNLSKKKLFRYTKTISKLGSSVAAKGRSGTGVVTINTSSDYAKVYAAPDTFSWAGVGWELVMPEATIYESFYVRVFARRSGSPGVNHLGAQQFSRSGCGYSSTAAWNEDCFGSFATISVTSGTTLYYYKTANLTSGYRSGRKVRIMVSTTGGSIWVYKAAVVVKYGILKYP